MANIYVGLSGGVDSATSAALLKEQGHNVTGVFIKIWQPEFIECTWREDRLDAMRVAASLGIPFREIDLSAAYKKEVVDSMIRDYQAGITPNPDVLCNSSIKFGAFKVWALTEGADAVATGHYAQTINGKLFRGADTNKDQSYFLYQLLSTDLEQIIFPIGHLTKTQVRKKAERLCLPVAHKQDSQGLCFIGDVSLEDFLRRFIELAPGVVTDIHGSVIGKHRGAALYTIGQRHGFTITDAPTAHIPYYIIAIDTETNVVAVSPERTEAMRSSISIRDLRWIRGAPRPSTKLQVQVRYRTDCVGAKLSTDATNCELESPQICSPGQSIVFYSEMECLGGAIIERFARM